MSKTIKIAHEKIKAYLKGEADPEIVEIRIKEPLYGLLFDLIDQAKRSYPDFEEISKSDVTTSFSAIEDMLSEMVSGATQEQEAKNFLADLQGSSIFYDRILVKLAQLTPAISEETIPELSEVEMESDKKILTKMGIIAAIDKDESLQVSANGGVEKNWIRNWVHGLIDGLKPWPKYAYALAAAACILITIFISGDLLQQDDPFSEFVWDEKVPYEYDVSSFRGADDVPEEDSQFRDFVNQFKLGMSDYVICNYAGAIKTFNRIEPIALKLLSIGDTRVYISMLRRYYFYLGLSYLAMGRGTHISKDDKEVYLQNSIRTLSNLKALIEDYELEDYDKENYFLGLAYWFSGNRTEAETKLKKIRAQSEYYEKSIKLLKKL